MIRFKGEVVSCNDHKSKKGTNGFIVNFKGSEKSFYYWNETGFEIGDILEFDYEESEFNGKMYYTIKSLLNIQSNSLLSNEQQDLNNCLNKELDKDIIKLQIENDRLNRLATLIKVSFDYGNRKNKEMEEIMADVGKLLKFLENRNDNL